MNLDTLGGRKFLMTILALVSANALCWFGHISDTIYSAVVIATVAAYITGNVIQTKQPKP